MENDNLEEFKSESIKWSQDWEKEKQRAEAIEEKAHSAEIPFAVAGIDFTELPAEVITLIDVVVKADRRRLLNEHAIEVEQLESDHFARIQEKIREYNELEEHTKRIEANESKLAEEVTQLSAKVFQLDLEKRDAEEKRDAAVFEKEAIESALNGAQDEIAHLQAEVYELKRAKEYSNRQTEQVSANEEETASISAAVEAVKKLYEKVEDWGSIQKVIKPDGSFELATRAEVEAEWAPVPPELPFRDEVASTEIVAPEVDTKVDQFHNPSEQHGDNKDVDGSNVAPLGEAVSRAEFEARMTNVEKGMEQLMRRVFGEVAA